MEWLQKILTNAVYGDDGKLDMESTMKKINEEASKHIVPKEQYNSKVNELNAANGTITTLKNDNEGNDTLQKTIETHEATISKLQKENEDMKKTYSLKAALSESGCTDPDYLIFKHGGIDKFSFDEEGKPVDCDKIAKSYKESLPHIFPAGKKQQRYNPAGGGGDKSVNPFEKATWNMTEQGKLFKENPDQARELAAAAGATII